VWHDACKPTASRESTVGDKHPHRAHRGTASIVADPKTLLSTRFRAALEAAFGEEWADTDPLIRPSSFGDYQANLAMSLAKRLRRAPREVAAALVEHLEVGDVCESVEVSGPGFINLTLRADWIANQATRIAADDRLGVPLAAEAQVTVVDYSAPNVAKEMHVGHLRSTVIGDALVRVLGFLGNRVIRQNHLGDWGAPFGMLIEHLIDIGAADSGVLSVHDLNLFYQQAREKFDGDPDFAERARRRVVELQAGDEATLRLWRMLVDESLRHFRAIYDRLGVLLIDDDLDPESRYNPELPGIVAELTAKGLLRESQGALCVFPPGFTGRDGEPLPLIVRNSIGGYNYATTDLAAVRKRVEEFGATHLVYVVGAPQALHFAMVFATCRMAGWLDQRHRAEHAPFGSILGPDGKMLRTRSGDPTKLVDLLDEAEERAAKVVEDRGELSPEARAGVAHIVAMSALKYFDLSFQRERDYVFDWDRMLSFDGNTGPYLQYAVTRIRSIFRRAGISVEDAAGGPIAIAEPAERALTLKLLGLGEAVETVAAALEPHRLTTYLFELATAFTDFYEACPVLQADEAVRASRLALCALTARALTLGLDLLGIRVPERM
jgi:arginyl-tRNA synthetase